MRACSTTSVSGARHYYAPMLATAASFVPMARCRAHRYNSRRARVVSRPLDAVRHNVPFMTSADSPKQSDWVSNLRARLVACDLPTVALIGGIFIDPPMKTLVWTTALVWMGVACLANARRCGRRHCYFTGPFFLLMATVVVLHGFEIVWLGSHGWIWVGITLVVVGWGVLWYLPERIWGKFTDRSASPGAGPQTRE